MPPEGAPVLDINEEPRGKPRGINTKFKPADLQSALRRKRRGIRPGGIESQTVEKCVIEVLLPWDKGTFEAKQKGWDEG